MRLKKCLTLIRVYVKCLSMIQSSPFYQDIARKIIDASSSYRLEVDRTSNWLSIMAFYKSCIGKPEKLAKELIIRFTNESGADSGALPREFFEDAIAEANLNLLEGEDDKRMIKKDWGLESVYEMLGSLTAHSILQNGPGLRCLSPVIYNYIAKQNTYPEVQDIPLSLGTHKLISLIAKVTYNLIEAPACTLRYTPWDRT